LTEVTSNNDPTSPQRISVEDLKSLLTDLNSYLLTATTSSVQQLADDAEGAFKRYTQYGKDLLSGLFSIGSIAFGEKEVLEQALRQAALERIGGLVKRDKLYSIGRWALDETREQSSTVRTAANVMSHVQQVLNGGQDVYLALAYSLVLQAKEKAEDQVETLDRLGRIISEMIAFLEDIYGQDLYRQMIHNRRIAITYLRLSERSFRRSVSTIDQGSGFDVRYHDQGMDQLEAAQVALATFDKRDLGPLTDFLIKLGSGSLSAEDTWELLGSRWEEIGDDINRRLDRLLSKSEVVLRSSSGTFTDDRTLVDSSASFGDIKAGDQLVVEGVGEVSVRSASETEIKIVSPLAVPPGLVSYTVVQTDEETETVRDALQEARNASSLKDRLAAIRRIGPIVQDALSFKFLRAQRLVADANLQINRARDNHRQVLQRHQALFALASEIPQGQRAYLALLRNDLLDVADRIRAIRSDMEDSNRRLQIMSATASWMLRISALRGHIESLISETTRQDLIRDRDRIRFSDAYESMINRLRDLDLEGSTRIDELEDTWKSLISRFEQALSGREETPEDLVRELRSWRNEVARATHAYRRALYAYASVPKQTHVLVTSFNQYIDSHYPLLEGIRWMVDSGRWADLGKLSDKIVSLPGLASFHLSRSVLALPIDIPTKNFINRLTAWLDSEHESIEEELRIADDGSLTLVEHIRGQVEQQDAALSILRDIESQLRSIDNLRGSCQNEMMHLYTLKRVVPSPLR